MKLCPKVPRVDGIKWIVSFLARGRGLRGGIVGYSIKQGRDTKGGKRKRSRGQSVKTDVVILLNDGEKGKCRVVFEDSVSQANETSLNGSPQSNFSFLLECLWAW